MTSPLSRARAATLLTGAALAACFVDTPPTMGETTTTTTGSESETVSCPPGEAGCPCLPGRVCGEGLACKDEVCSDAASCGDGAIDVGEACDDGNDDETDACLSTCALASCGDGYVQAGVEACDDGNPVDGDGCNIDCQPSGLLSWSVSVPGDALASDVGRAVAVDPNGEIAVAGTLTTMAGGADAFVARYSAAGALVWSQIFDGDLHKADDAHAIAFAANGDLIVGGALTEAGMMTNNVRAWLFRVDGASGVPVWSIAVDGSAVDGGDQIRDVLVDDDGTIVVAGWKNNTTTGNDAWVARYSAEGAEIWSTLIGGGVAGDDRLFGVAAGAQGELVLCGQIDVGGQLDAWVATYSNNGAEKWARTFNSAGTDKDVAYACAANQVGTVFTGVTATTATGSDFWLVVHNALGDPTVSQLHGDPDLDEFARAVAVDKDGNLVIVGADSAVGTGTNLMIRKYRSTTDLLWKHSLAGPGTSNDHGYGVATDGLGNVIVAGTQAVGIADDLELWVGKLTP